MARVNKALSLLPPEEKLPPIPGDTSAASLLAAGRTLTPTGLVEAVQDIYGIDVAEERPRPKAFWFSLLLARHTNTLEEWKKLLGKHGMISNPKIEKWLLFRAGASSPATAGRLKARLGSDLGASAICSFLTHKENEEMNTGEFNKKYAL